MITPSDLSSIPVVPTSSPEERAIAERRFDEAIRAAHNNSSWPAIVKKGLDAIAETAWTATAERYRQMGWIVTLAPSFSVLFWIQIPMGSPTRALLDAALTAHRSGTRLQISLHGEEMLSAVAIWADARGLTVDTSSCIGSHPSGEQRWTMVRVLAGEDNIVTAHSAPVVTASPGATSGTLTADESPR